MHVFLASNRSGDKTGKRRSFAEEIQFIKRINGCHFKIKMGFVERMQVEGSFYVNRHLEKLMFDELRHHVSAAGVGGFLPGSNCLQIVCAIARTKSRIPTVAMKQIANVAALPGIVGVRNPVQIYFGAPNPEMYFRLLHWYLHGMFFARSHRSASQMFIQAMDSR